MSLRVTITDIAKRTGFSPTTISQILNGKGSRFSEETRQIVKQAVRESGYRPNQIAVSLVKRTTKTLGLIISDIRNVFFSNLAKGVEDKCWEMGWNLILCNTNDLHVRDLESIKVLADKGVDGILYAMASECDAEKANMSLNLIESLKVPYVMLDRTLGEHLCNIVATNHQKGGYLATKYLIDAGHERIACITGPLYLDDTKQRLDGYRTALSESSIPFRQSLIYEGNYTLESGMDSINVLKEGSYTAVFAFNDMSAYGVYSRLRAKGADIPNDISIVGYDDIFFSELLDVPLTSVHQPVYEVGTEAAALIIGDTEINSKTPRQVILEPSLTIRSSVARCKS